MTTTDNYKDIDKFTMKHFGRKFVYLISEERAKDTNYLIKSFYQTACKADSISGKLAVATLLVMCIFKCEKLELHNQRKMFAKTLTEISKNMELDYSAN
jgi:hypothetical protein